MNDKKGALEDYKHGIELHRKNGGVFFSQETHEIILAALEAYKKPSLRQQMDDLDVLAEIRAKQPQVSNEKALEAVQRLFIRANNLVLSEIPATDVEGRRILHRENARWKGLINEALTAPQKMGVESLKEAKEKLESVGICIDLETVHDAIDQALNLLEKGIINGK